MPNIGLMRHRFARLILMGTAPLIDSCHACFHVGCFWSRDESFHVNVENETTLCCEFWGDLYDHKMRPCRSSIGCTQLGI